MPPTPSKNILKQLDLQLASAFARAWAETRLASYVFKFLSSMHPLDNSVIICCFSLKYISVNTMHVCTVTAVKSRDGSRGTKETTRRITFWLSEKCLGSLFSGNYGISHRECRVRCQDSKEDLPACLVSKPSQNGSLQWNCLIERGWCYCERQRKADQGKEL